jgi:molecular chaperone GrpE
MFNKTSPSEQKQAVELQSEEAMSSTEAVASENGSPEQGQVSAAQVTEPVDTDEWKSKAQQLQDQYTRLAADFDNFRKRSRDEQESLIKYGAQKSIMELLPVLDNLERANASLNENSDPQALYKSFSLMQKQLLDGLAAIGVNQVSSVGQPFDPQFHEAINRMPSADYPENTIMYEAQSGYQLHDKVIRPALVVVSTGAPQPTAGEPSTTSSAEGERPDNPFAK